MELNEVSYARCKAPKYPVIIAIVVGVICLSIVVAACVAIDRYKHSFDSTSKYADHEKKLWGGYEWDRQYRVVTPIFLMGNDKIGYVLTASNSVTPRLKDASIPDTIEEYRNDPSKWPKVTAEIEQETLVTVKHFLLNHSFENNTAEVYAEISNGPFKGKTACISRLSEPFKFDTTLHQPDESLLGRLK